MPLIRGVAAPQPVQPQPVQPTVAAEPKSNWYVQKPEINPIDGAKTQFLSLDSHEGETENHYISGLGGFPSFKSHAQLVLTFKNGGLTRSPQIGARCDVNKFIGSDGSSVRLKFDGEKSSRESWSSSDSHKSLFPYGHETLFLTRLLAHKKLAFEFSPYEEASQVVTFDLTGLSDDMKKAALRP